MRDPRGIQELGIVTENGRDVGRLVALCTVEDLRNFEEQVLVAIERWSGEVSFMIVRMGNA